MLKTPNADLNNIGGPVAGALTAGLFLQEFVPDGTPWAHLDIAGPFIREKDWKYYEAGAIGFGLKTLVDHESVDRQLSGVIDTAANVYSVD